jgi:hypothetical protein
MSFMLANNKFDNMAEYHKLHDKLVDSSASTRATPAQPPPS